MGGVVRIIGWLVTAVAIGAAVVLGVQWRNAKAELDTALKSNAALEGQVQELLASLHKSAEATSARLTDLERKLAEAESARAKLESGHTEGGEAPGQTASGESGADATAENKAPFGDMMKGMGEMFKGEQGKELAKASVRMGIDMQYGSLFKDLKLPADVESQVRDIIAKGMEGQMEAGLAIFSGEKPDMEKMKKLEETSKKETREALAKVLSADELAAYDAYQEEMPRHMLEQQFDMQMSMFASGLSAESRGAVRDVLVEEMLAAHGKKPSGSTMINPNPAQEMNEALAAVERARERMREQLDAEQFAQADRFFEQQINQFRMAQQMVGSMFGGDAGKKPATAPQKK